MKKLLFLLIPMILMISCSTFDTSYQDKPGEKYSTRTIQPVLDTVNIGTGPNTGNGDPLRSAFIKVNWSIKRLNTVQDSILNRYTKAQANALFALITNPTFYGVQKLSTTDTLSTKSYARTVGGGGLTSGDVAGQINDSIEARLTGAYDIRYLILNQQTGTSYTLVLTDLYKLVTMSNGSANTLTVPLNSSVAFPYGATHATQITVANIGAGICTLTAAGGVTFISGDNYVALHQGYGATLVKIAENTWWITGGME